MKNRAAGLILMFVICPLFALATHLRAGEITVERTNCTSLIFKITITVYTNTGSEIKFGEGLLDYGDGSTHTTPTIDNTIVNVADKIGTVSYSVLHSYSGPGRYVISYLEPNRNGGIVNIFNSVETRFYIETVINIDPLIGCNNSPKLLVPPIDKACVGAAWVHNPGAFDPDGDSVSFEMTIPKKDKGQVVGNYRDPNNKEFYGPDYGIANEDKDGPPIFNINPITGTLIWDSPGRIGEFNIAFLIKEWRKISGTWVLMGYVVRDMQIIVDDCDNQRPELIVPADICVEAGTLITEDIFGFDPDSDSVKIEAFSQVFGLSPNGATIIPSPAKFQKSSPSAHAKIKFQWQTTCNHIKEQPYQVVFKITDNPPPSKGARLVQFATWNITVVGPAPKWNSAAVVPSTRNASLSWDPYVCQNATRMQVWRRVDEMPYTVPECVTGMPEFLGYTLINTVPITQSTYLDKNLAIGAQYCYRLVAVFPAPNGGESYLSLDTCLDPIKATAPIITNVSVDKTDVATGMITVKWVPPFELDPLQFPPPYEYQVLRSEGITGKIKQLIPHPGKLNVPTFQDQNLNTEGVVYNYRIIAFDANGFQLPDTADRASSVRLETRPQIAKIELTWFAAVPWSNRIEAQSDTYQFRHLIYRGPANAADNALELIDSVDVNRAGFTYLDQGTFKGQALKDTEIYCYRVQTRGSYGNPDLPEPLFNFSQKICAQPNDTVPPCKPELKIVAKSCEDVLKTMSCGNTLFSNTLTWNKPSDDCRNDVRSYNIYFADKIGNDFLLLAENVLDTFFVDTKLTNSNARCYKVEAVDRSGNKSDLSEEFCFDNCPYYELPNVFTPNGDGCNPLFSAFSDRVKVGEDGRDACDQLVDFESVRAHCARFVDAVYFKVYNRWGVEVYNYTGDTFGRGGERSIWIDWDGRDLTGQELSEGVYYYVAEVTYNVVDPAKAKQSLKGWVHLVR